jgi:hypothetical protein
MELKMNESLFNRKDLFDKLIKRIKIDADQDGIKLFRAFPKWFIQTYFINPFEYMSSDGSRDSKIDAFCKVQEGNKITYKVINSKFTENYGKTAPSQFYDEIIALCKMFDNKSQRDSLLHKYSKSDLKSHYKVLFENYDQGNTQLFFITNYRINPNQIVRIEDLDIEVFHLDEILGFLIEDLIGGMPFTNPLLLTGINSVLSANTEDTIVPTSIIFARLIDFINYMKNDQLDFLFSRNVRLNLGKTEPNKSVMSTFHEAPKEFVFSNNGITIICDRSKYDTGNHELKLTNPRVVNGSQTLHSIRDVKNPSKDARVMVRIIQIQTNGSGNFEDDKRLKIDIVNKIAIRSNLQNPIYKWNLAANDEYQNVLKKYFNQKKLFYETRKKEWDNKKSYLKSNGYERGPFMPKLMQVLASYYYKEKNLGPANAKGQLNELFDLNKAYLKITSTIPEIVYQIYLFDELIKFSISELSNLNYINKIKKHCNYALFSLYTKLIDELSIEWGSKEFTEFLESTFKDYPNSWTVLTKKLVGEVIIEQFKIAKNKYLNENGSDLSYNNYFKNVTHMKDLMNVKISSSIRAMGGAVFIID